MALHLLAAAFGLAAWQTSLAAQGAPPPFRDPARPVDERAADLLARMTVEEKVAQLQALWKRYGKMQTPDGGFDPAGARELLGHGIGQIARPSEVANPPAGTSPTRTPRQHVAFANAVQRWLIDNTRLGIPAMFHEEALHGLVAPNGTQFPVPIGLASTWDPALVERVMSIAAVEARARGVHHVLSPVVDLGRDPRWGRIEETYGEDPWLVARLGVAAVRGYQGRSLPLAKDKVFATLKHFAGHGSHEGGINTAPALIPERLLRSELLVPFQAAITEAGAYTVMPSYNEVDGVPSHINGWLLEDVLRREWGFRGLVVADYFAVEQLISQHRVAADKADAARQALAAGVDIELPDPDAYPSLVAMIKNGRLPEADVDRAVLRVLRAKLLAGLFEHPFADADAAETASNTPAHRAAALDAARKSIVLLKNDNRALPLDRRRLKTLAVIGPNAKGVHLGGYSRDPGRKIDVLAGIQASAGSNVRVTYAEGVRITEHDADWNADKVVLGDPEKNRARIKEAIAVARQADAVVLVIGTNESTSREAWSDSHLGDVADLSLMSQQSDLVTAMLETGKPVIVVLVNGRPLAIPEVAARVPAVLENVVRGAGRRPRDRRGALRGRQSRRQAARHLPAPLGTVAGVLQSAADVVPLAPRRAARAAVAVRVRPELHDVYADQPEDRSTGDRHRWKGRSDRGSGEHRRPGRRRSRAALHPRRRELSHASHQRAPRIRARDVVAWRTEDRDLHAGPGGALTDRSTDAADRRTRTLRGDGRHQLSNATDRDTRCRLTMTISGGRVIVCSPGRNFVTLRLETEDGITGLGDATLNGRELAVASYLTDHVLPLLVGRDARRIEDIWQLLYKGAYWRRGPVTMTAIAAVDTALWDIKGKALGVPRLPTARRRVARRGDGLRPRERRDDRGHGGSRRPLRRAAATSAVRAQCSVPGVERTYGIGARRSLRAGGARSCRLKRAWSSERYLAVGAAALRTAAPRVRSGPRTCCTTRITG